MYTHTHTHSCICNIGCTYICTVCLLRRFYSCSSFSFQCTYTRTYINYLYAVTGFMFVLPGLTLKIFPLTNFLCYCRIALLFFFACCCCYYWCFCFFVCFALVVHPPVAKAASAMAIFDNVFGVTHTPTQTHTHAYTTTEHTLVNELFFFLCAPVIVLKIHHKAYAKRSINRSVAEIASQKIVGQTSRRIGCCRGQRRNARQQQYVCCSRQQLS